MPGIGSVGAYIDADENEYAAQVIGLSFTVGVVWRDAEGKVIATPESPAAAPPGAVWKAEKIETGKFEILATFRDGTQKVISDVDGGQIFEPALTAHLEPIDHVLPLPIPAETSSAPAGETPPP